MTIIAEEIMRQLRRYRMQDIKEAPRQIKVKTKKFSLKKGIINIAFEYDTGKVHINSVKLKKRNSDADCNHINEFEFALRNAENVSSGKCEAVLDVNGLGLDIGFWDVVCVCEDKKQPGEVYDAILGGLGTWMKIKFILFPRWTKTKEDTIIYPFVNGARQFTIQHRKYDRKYDSYRFIFKEMIALFCYFILKPYWDSKKLWLVCEKFCVMAQDNGLYFFRYCMENAPKEKRKKILYVIDKECPDYQAVKEYDENVIQFMSFKYMIYLQAAQYLISTDAIRHFYIWDSPNSVYKVLYQARKHIIFLQHGVMGFKQCHRTFHKKGGNKMARFVVSSEFEKKIIEDYFEYDSDDIIVTGLARWDVLKSTATGDNKEILLMPTWRSWLEDSDRKQFENSEYYKRYRQLLEDDSLQRLLEENDITLNFYIHPKFREHMESFSAGCDRIHLIPFGETPLNKLLMSAHMLITDYSSVAWDVYYQEKPVVFYPFDRQTYEERQGSYMDYDKDLFGDVVYKQQDLIAAIKYYVDNGFNEKQQYVAMRDYLLPLRDNKNSERIYNCIDNLIMPGKLFGKIR